MLYNLMILDDKAGINLATIQLAKDGIDEMTGQIASGMVKAIRDLLRELKMGTIKSFETHERQVLVYKEEAILSALICDTGDDLDIITERLQEITHMFVEALDWENWKGNTTQLDPIIAKAKELLVIDIDEIIEHIKEHMVEIVPKSSKITGYKLVNNNVVSAQNLEKITDFEIKSFLESNMFSMLQDNVEGFENTIQGLDISNLYKSSFIDYGKFSILVKNIFKKIKLFVFLPGMIDPITDLPIIEKELEEIGGF